MSIWGGGDEYERLMGRWSRLVASEFLDWLDVPAGRDWLDVGCGTGALSRAILDRCEPRSVTGVDPAEGFVAHARANAPGATFDVADAQALPFDGCAFDAVVSALVLNFVPDATAAAREFRRVLRTGGRAAAYVWDYAEGMQLLRTFWDAAIALDPAVAELDEGPRFALANPAALGQLFAGAGFADVETRAVEVLLRFVDFDDYWSPFLGGQGPAGGYVATLDDERRHALREQLRETLSTEADGSISLTARAWAVRGRR